ncbi:phosphotransferase [Palaeococcus ferrophilus]|uniref:phosphotransferase n=1 Tax=Palaeococcus ferrophilus TaxID=83868 RepID=UPI0006973248|nr:phosphotransferase [Palaeococcus ferrophilus]
MMAHLLDEITLQRFEEHLKKRDIRLLRPFSKGTTSLIFLGEWKGEKVIIKLERADTPRHNLRREFEILMFLRGRDIAPEPVAHGTFEEREYLVRRFVPGEPILYADVEREHILEIARKTLALDRLNLDHGQIQGGKHILIGEGVYIIDFEKAGFRKPKNLTSAMAMLFLNDNTISKRLASKFGLGEDFRERLRGTLGEYKRKGNEKNLSRLLSEI